MPRPGRCRPGSDRRWDRPHRRGSSTAHCPGTPRRKPPRSGCRRSSPGSSICHRRPPRAAHQGPWRHSRCRHWPGNRGPSCRCSAERRPSSRPRCAAHRRGCSPPSDRPAGGRCRHRSCTTLPEWTRRRRAGRIPPGRTARARRPAVPRRCRRLPRYRIPPDRRG